VAKRYSIAEARKKLPGLIDEAQAGTSVELTRRGRSVAVLVSVDEFERLKERRPSFVDAHAAFRKRFPAERGGIEPRYFRSLRDRSPGRKVDV
jgi:prevent-host-death family protein